MDQQLFIAGDWGTSSLRLYLCDGDHILDTKTGKGISKLTASPAKSLLELIKPWRDSHGKCPVYLSGMVGSNLGWRITPYATCPASADTLCSELTHIQHQDYDIYITSGLSCTNMLGSTDFMRGEETQILGAIELYPDLKQGTHILCLPGTHTKWVLLKDGTIEKFHTALTGELYALLLDHSILVHTKVKEGPEWLKALKDGLKRSAELGEAALLHSLFEVRARQITQELIPDEAAAYLSGLVIGRDISGAIALFQNYPALDNPVTIIGDPKLSQAYKTGFDLHNIVSIERDGSTAVLAGLRTLIKA